MTEFARCPDGTFPQRGTWRPALSDGKRVAIFCCPKCDFRAALGDLSHSIAPDGTVSPSVVCDGAGCDFHEFVKLAGWEAAP